VRVVIDIKSFKTYKIFSLKNPFKTIIDVWGKDAREAAPSNVVKAPESEQPKPENSHLRSSPKMINDLAKQLALGVRRIVIDPGHGGKDVGAVGYYKSVYEKNVTLAIAKKLAQKIRSRLNCEVFLTRTTDRGLSLEERTAIANTRNADLFISIHTNASQNDNAYGIETYFLNLATDDDAILVAARENATSRKNISDLQTILHDLMQNSKINESGKLAGYVQQSVHRQLKARYVAVRNKGVKQAPFYVLMGAQMPSILIETSFISNKRECERLNNPAYQDWLCEAIVQGIQRYIRETNPTAFMKEDRGNATVTPETDETDDRGNSPDHS
jgi:N-acetylmuramoyl-L-alanine amidase